MKKIFSQQTDNTHVMDLLLTSKSYTTATLSYTVCFLISVHNCKRTHFSASTGIAILIETMDLNIPG